MFNQNQYTYNQVIEQVSREEIAQLQQTIQGLKQHISNRQRDLYNIGATMKTPEDVLKHSVLQLEQNRDFAHLKSYTSKLEEMLKNAQFNFGKNLSKEVKKQIYHLYKSGKYTQVELANQYNTTQSTVNKIVNGSIPE